VEVLKIKTTLALSSIAKYILNNLHCVADLIINMQSVIATFATSKGIRMYVIYVHAYIFIHTCALTRTRAHTHTYTHMHACTPGMFNKYKFLAPNFCVNKECYVLLGSTSGRIIMQQMVQESGSHVLSWDRLMFSGMTLETWSCKGVHTVILFLDETCMALA
jgi:hypothetical protein